jgi:hypothetical protein
METTNNLKHTVNGENFKIEIRLNDECKNGHQDFAITATFWERGKPHNDKYMTMGGCCHEEILRVKPKLKPFVDLHLSTAKGVPMYAIENGFYFLKNGGNNGKSPKDVLIDYLRINEKEFEILAHAEDKIYFQALIEKLGIPERWLNEANEAIELLEEMTGKKFVNDSTKTGFIPLGEKLKEVENLIKSGYYKPEKIQARENEKIAEQNEKIKKDLKKERDTTIKKANQEYNVKIAVANAGLSLKNFIYYNHSNEGSFNWLSYEKQITTEQLAEFIRTVDYSKLPEGIKFKMSAKK